MPCNVEIILLLPVSAVHGDVFCELLGPHVAAHHLRVALRKVHGDQTVKAAAAFQKDNGLPATGEADDATQRLLLEKGA